MATRKRRPAKGAIAGPERAAGKIQRSHSKMPKVILTDEVDVVHEFLDADTHASRSKSQLPKFKSGVKS